MQENPKVILRPKSPPPQHEGLSLESIPSPKLTPIELTQTEFEQDLIVIIKKCEFIGRFDIIPPTLLSSLLCSEDKIHHLAEARLMSGEGPHKFYLMWRRDVYISALLQKWLKSLIELQKIDEVDSDELEELKGGWVAAQREDGNWYRAKVAEVYCGDKVSIMYPDLGDKCFVLPLERLAHLPANLWDHPGLCLRACLAGVSKDDAEWDSNEYINKGFIQPLETLDFLGAEIVREDEDGTAEVNLWECFKNGYTGVSINERVQKYISEWSEDIRYGLTPEDIQKITIKENDQILHDKAKQWQFIRVINPDYFTVRVAGDKDRWKERMQNFYNGLESGRLKIRQGRVEPLQCYAYHCAESLSWDRVQITNVDNETNSCVIYFWDKGVYKRSEFAKLRKLIPEFCSQLPEAYRCHLAHVLPTSKGENGQLEWSGSAKDEFRRLAPEGTITTGVIVTCEKINVKNVGLRLNLGVIVLDQVESDIQYLSKSNLAISNSIQFRLFELDLAIPNGIGAGGWGILENFQNTILPLPEFSQKFMDQSSSLLWKKTYDYYATWSAPNAPYKRKFMPSEIRKYLCWVKIVRAQSPTCLFVQIQEQIPALMHMMNTLENSIKKDPTLTLCEVKPASYIAVHLRLTGHGDDMHWHRAIVLKVLPNERIKTLLIDFGLLFDVSIEVIKCLPKKFQTQPSFAHRVHLEFPNLTPTHFATYTNECCDLFRKYVKSWNTACPIYYIWQRNNNRIIEVDDITQNLQFNFAEGRYEICKQKSLVDDAIMLQMKNTPILSHLFLSIGVIIEYEDFNPPQDPYTFTKLHKILVDRGFAHT